MATGVALTTFGTLVAAGVVAGVFFAEARARRVGTPEEEIHWAIVCAVVPGFMVAHLFAVMPGMGSTVAERPMVLLEFWNGMSAFGGFAGAAAGLALRFAVRPRATRLQVAEILIQALVVLHARP